MPIISAELRQANVPEERIRAFEDAVRSSLARARTEVPFWAGSKTMKFFLGLQDSDTVSVAIGTGARYGKVTANTPAVLSTRLFARLEELGQERVQQKRRGPNGG